MAYTVSSVFSQVTLNSVLGIFSSMSETAGGQRRRETFIFHNLEIYSEFGKECYKEHCCGVGIMCEGLFVLGLCVLGAP